MEWNTHEQFLAESIADTLNTISLSSSKPKTFTSSIRFSPNDAVGLIEGLREQPFERLNYLPIRHLYSVLGFNEGHPFQWRLEHKLVQALVMEVFCPGSVPVTCGLSTYVLNNCWRDVEHVRTNLNLGFVKRTLGSNASSENSGETTRATEHVLSMLGSRSGIASKTLTEEEWIIQERIDIVEEYRVHTIETSVVPDLTFYRHSGRPLGNERDAPNSFVASLALKLPLAFLSNSICGWDICRTAAGPWKVIEVNFAGFHPVVERGFQCSGFFVREPWGTYLVARLLAFVERQYSVTLLCETVYVEPPAISDMYFWISKWSKLIRIINLVADLNSEPLLSVEEFQCIKHSSAHQLFEEVLGRLHKTTALLM